ncbi:MAG: FimV/HubP family polar landmark protein [Candidatus Competibacteraceae bacterium]
MTRNVFRCWLASLLLGPVCAFALEVGEIQVDSALNQLFDARIPLPTLSPEELGRISVKVASPTMFKEFGLDRGATLDNLVFSIQYDAEGKVYVKVVSIKPIHEPSLALLLEFGWPRGKTFREFTVLLDPVRRLVEQPAAGRTKTVLDTSADTEAESSSEPPPLADIVVNRTIQYPDQPTSSTEASSSGSWVYRPGDVYGPVASGEGLWGIALKVRPDPGITRDQMMQALFQANPDAFSKVGVDGLRIGALLRIPTFQEIADFTGSAVARQLAATEKAAAEKAETDDAETGIASTGGAPAPVMEPAAGTNAGKLAVFPLARPSALEPTPPVPEPKPEVFISEPAVVAIPESKPEVPESAMATASEPKPEVSTSEPTVLAAPEPKLEVSTSEPATAAASEPEIEVPEPAAVTASEPKSEVSTFEPVVVAALEPKPEVPTPEPAAVTASEPAEVAVSEPKPEIVEPDPTLSTVASGLVAPTVVAPVSATPLLFLVVSEVMASATAQVPRVPIAPQSLSDERIVDAMASAPALALGASAVTPSELDYQATAEPRATPQATNGTSATVAADVFELSPTADVVESLVAESIVRPVAGFTVLPVFESAEIVPVTNSAKPPAMESAAPSRVEPAEVAEVVEPPGVEPAEVTEVTEVAEVAEPADSAVVKSKKPAMPAYKEGDQYGPVMPNERLWDIATKVRPTPDIGVDIMMKALFAINPTAFSKEGMDYLKVGVTLRIPTLREIVDHTGSKVAKQLLEQQAAANQVAEPEGSTQVPPSPPPAAASGSDSGSEPNLNRSPSRRRPPLIEDGKTLSKERAGL